MMELVYVAQVLFMVNGFGVNPGLIANLPLGKPHIYKTYVECMADVKKVQPVADVIPETDLNGGKIIYICVPVGVYYK